MPSQVEKISDTVVQTYKGWFVWLPLLVFFDQISKWVAVHYFKLGDSLAVIPGLRLVLAHNYGVAFGMFNENELLSRLMVLLMAIAISSLVGIWLYRTPKSDKLQGFALVCILGGALGNIVDRLFRGYVVDFIECYYKTWQWPAFNIADSFITVGAFLLILTLFRSEKK